MPPIRPASDTVSIVIPALDEEERLPALLDSLSRQTQPIHEVIVADAGSTDRTAAVARQAGACVIRGGLPAEGRNAGAAIASGAWVLFLDADVVLEPDDVASALRQVRTRRLDGASCAFVPDSRKRFLRFNHWLSSRYFRVATKLGWPHSIGAFLLVRRERHEALDGFDTTVTVAEDQDYVRRLARIGGYEYLVDPVVQVAARRFETLGALTMSLRWIVIELHRIFLGEIRGDYIPYFEKRPPAEAQQSTSSISSG